MHTSMVHTTLGFVSCFWPSSLAYVIGWLKHGVLREENPGVPMSTVLLWVSDHFHRHVVAPVFRVSGGCTNIRLLVDIYPQSHFTLVGSPTLPALLDL